jgi:phosphoribosylformylglycinamidine synthase
LEKLLLEACLEAMQTGAVIGIQDMGAAGLTCSTCEMGARGSVGLEIELDRVPQRETGMTPYEIMLSESQERMLLVAEAGREGEVFRVFRKWGLDAVTIGRVTSDSRLRVLEHGRVVAEIPNSCLTDEAPLYSRPLARWEPPDMPRELPPDVVFGQTDNLTAAFKRLLGSPNICSKRFITEQYETYVQLVGVQRPGADAGVVRVKGTQRGLAMSLDGHGRWCYLDPKLGAMHAVAEASRNVACTGARPLAITNCLNFGNPEKLHIMWQFSQVIEGMTRACEELDLPVTGGNVSFYNETLGEGIYPTPVIGVVGLLEQVDRAVQHAFAAEGRSIVLLRGSDPGDLTDAQLEFGSSEYAVHILNRTWGFPPALELEKEAALQSCLVELARQGLLDSAHDCSDGGLAVAIAESGFPREIGATLNLVSDGLPSEYVLFGEDASRIVISCEPENLGRIQQTALKWGVEAIVIGQTAPGRLEIHVDGKPVISASLREAKSAWESALEQALHSGSAQQPVPQAM